jgi:ABC-type multidrug transport system fused ATPase/permease subunit
MDEATASIDFKTESIIQNAVESLFKNSTVIIIAHRLNTVLKCDRILKLNKGEIEAFDTPEELKKLNLL